MKCYGSKGTVHMQNLSRAGTVAGVRRSCMGRGSRGLLLRVAGCRARSWRRDLSGRLGELERDDGPGA